MVYQNMGMLNKEVMTSCIMQNNRNVFLMCNRIVTAHIKKEIKHMDILWKFGKRDWETMSIQILNPCTTSTHKKEVAYKFVCHFVLYTSGMKGGSTGGTGGSTGGTEGITGGTGGSTGGTGGTKSQPEQISCAVAPPQST